jgi:hypothetical protein
MRRAVEAGGQAAKKPDKRHLLRAAAFYWRIVIQKPQQQL